MLQTSAFTQNFFFISIIWKIWHLKHVNTHRYNIFPSHTPYRQLVQIFSLYETPTSLICTILKTLPEISLLDLNQNWRSTK